MTLLFHFLVCFGLLVVQAAVLPCAAFFSGFYDLLLPAVVYLGLFHRPRESLPVLLWAGFVNDNLSGAPFGAFTVVYLWLFIAERWIIRYVQATNVWLWVFAVAAGVLVQNLLFWGCQLLFAEGAPPVPGAGRTAAVQLVWALATGPLLLAVIARFDKSWQTWRKSLRAA